jgi:hypothetical protein
MLLVWVLALLTTIVNACIVVPHGQTAGLAVDATVAHHCQGEAGPESPVHAAAKSACAKFCDEDASGATSALRVADSLGSAGLALLPTWALAVQAAQEPQRLIHTDDGTMPPSVPVAIAFLRLTL